MKRKVYKHISHSVVNLSVLRVYKPYDALRM